MQSVRWFVCQVLGALILISLSALSVAQMVEETTMDDVPEIPEDAYTPPPIRGQNLDGLRVYIRAGLKTHGEGRHDYPQFLADWSKLLTDHGAVVDGSLHFPSAEELAGVDVMLIHKGDFGYMSLQQRSDLEDFVRRGGGLVAIHDVICGPNPAYMASLMGGGKKHGERNFSSGAITYDVVDPDHPIMQGVPQDLTIQDESFFLMTWADSPDIHVLATAVIPESGSAGEHAGEVVPQIWTYEHRLPGGEPARAFVWMQGHLYTNIGEDPMKSMLLRGIAWAGHRPVDELVDYEPPADDDD